MIRGRVSSTRTPDGTAFLEARVNIDIAGSRRDFKSIEVVVDTGFTGFLTLPQTVINEIGLDTFGQRPAILANGDMRLFDVYGAVIQWEGRERAAIVHASDGKSLLGMALLSGNRIVVDAKDGGDVSIEALE